MDVTGTVTVASTDSGAPPPRWTRGLWRTVVSEGRLYLRDPAGLFFTLAFPVLLLALTGSGGNRPLEEYGGVGRMDLQVAGYLGMVMATMSIMGMPESLSQYREWGVLRRLRATPMKPSTLIVAYVVLASLVTVVGAALLVAVGLIGFGLNLPEAALPAVVAFGAGTAAMLALAFLLASLPLSARSTQALATVIFFPMIFVSGATFPTEELPALARALGDILPLSYAVDALKDAWLDGVWNVPALAVMIATAAGCAGTAVRWFRWE